MFYPFTKRSVIFSEHNQFVIDVIDRHIFCMQGILLIVVATKFAILGVTCFDFPSNISCQHLVELIAVAAKYAFHYIESLS